MLSRTAELLGGERVLWRSTSSEGRLPRWRPRCSWAGRTSFLYVPGRTVDRVRDAYRGEAKSDPRDAAFVIADQLRLRYRSLQEVLTKSEDLLAELKESWSATGATWGTGPDPACDAP